MRVNSPGLVEAGGEGGAPGCGAGGCAEGGLTELNILVKAPGSEERSGCDAPTAGLSDSPGAGSGFFWTGTWLNIFETSCEGAGAAVVGGTCSIEVKVCSIRVNSPGPDFAADGGGTAGSEASGESAAFSAAAAGALACVRSDASRSSSVAIGCAETCPKIPVALAASVVGEG